MESIAAADSFRIPAGAVSPHATWVVATGPEKVTKIIFEWEPYFNAFDAVIMITWGPNTDNIELILAKDLRGQLMGLTLEETLNCR